MNILQLTGFSMEAIITAALLLFLFHMRSRLGLAPLYITLGVFQPIQAILSSTIYVEVIPGVIVSPGSVIMFTASLFVILLTYIYDDAAETRKVVYGIMFANITMALFLFISGVQSNLFNTVNFLNLSRDMFNQNARIMLIGTGVLFVDSILLIFAYETASRLIHRNVFLRVYLTIAMILVFDSLAFTTGAFYRHPSYFTILVSSILGKLSMAAFYALALTFYLRFAKSTGRKTHPFQDIFNLLSYRQKFEIEHERGQQMESQLYESEGRYQTLTRMSPVGIFHTDAKGVTTYVNPKWCEISGVSFDDALGDGWLNVVHPDDKERVSKGWQGSTQLKKDSATDYRFLRPDGTIAWVMGQAVPEMNSENEVIGYIGTITDITERKQVEKVLYESEEKFSKVFHDSPIPMSISRVSDGFYIDVNDSLLKCMGYQREEMIGHTALELGLWANPTEREAMLNILEARSSIRGFEMQFRTKSGDMGTALIFHEIIKLAGEEHFIGTTLDITERKHAEEEIRLHRDRLAELSQRLVTAHETERRAIARELHDQFGQMLTALRLTLEIAQHLPAEESAKKVAMAQEIISDLSSRVSRLSLELRPPMLDDLGLIPALLWHINRYQEQTQTEVKFKHIGVEGKRLESDVETTAYRVIQEALTNVARHAQATSVRLEVRVRDEWLEILIEDNGQGFDPQAALAKNRGLGGMRERVKLLGGTFHIESRIGEGARQFVRLPFQEKTS